MSQCRRRRKWIILNCYITISILPFYNKELVIQIVPIKHSMNLCQSVYWKVTGMYINYDWMAYLCHSFTFTGHSVIIQFTEWQSFTLWKSPVSLNNSYYHWISISIGPCTKNVSKYKLLPVLSLYQYFSAMFNTDSAISININYQQ